MAEIRAPDEKQVGLEYIGEIFMTPNFNEF